MKKLFATILSLLFVATISFAVVGCKGNEEQRPEEAAVEAPVPEEIPVPEEVVPGEVPVSEAPESIPAPEEPASAED